MAATTATSSKSKTTKPAGEAPSAKTETRIGYIRQTGERAVDVPVGAVLTARERINGAVEPWTKSETRGRELRGLRRQVKGELDRFERRGGQARRKATDRVLATGNRVGERVRSVESTVQQSRNRLGDGLKKAQGTVRGRVSPDA